MCVCVCVCVYVSEKYIYVHEYKQGYMYICMYTTAKINAYVCTSLYIYLSIYLNVMFVVLYCLYYIYNPFKPRSSRSIHDVSKFTGTLTSHPTQTPKFTKHT